jgi:cytochrome c peroxidase
MIHETQSLTKGGKESGPPPARAKRCQSNGQRISLGWWCVPVLTGALAVSVLGGSISPQVTAVPLATLPRGLSSLFPVPLNNPMTHEKVRLGRRLFFENELSANRSLSCASCHQPGLAFADDQPRTPGIDGRAGRRNVPSLFNAAYQRTMFWDGRAQSLEQQALLPITNASELGNTLDIAVRRLAAKGDYPDLFRAAFGSEDITSRGIAQALASYQRTLVSADSRFDRYRQSGDESLLTGSEHRGLTLFRTKARCAHCHEEPLFTDHHFHNTGVGWKDRDNPDLGRFEWTRRDEDRGRFRTPSLRNVSRTAPYMHDGSLATLEEVIEFYGRGGRVNPYQDGAMQRLDLSDAEKRDLLAFLKTLEGTGVHFHNMTGHEP